MKSRDLFAWSTNYNGSLENDICALIREKQTHFKKKPTCYFSVSARKSQTSKIYFTMNNVI